MRRAMITPSELPTSFNQLVECHPPRVITDEVEYQDTMEWVDALTNLPTLSKGQTTYLETLSVLVEAYEEQHWTPGTDMTPVQVLRHLMEENDMNASALGELLGERSLGSKILSGSRDLSKSHIRKLADHFGVQADLFL